MSEEAEPTAKRVAAPVWLFVLFGGMFYWAQLYVDNHAGGFNAKVYAPYRSFEHVEKANPRDPVREQIAKGKALYAYCAGCHQESGMGTASPPVPPLAGSEWVQEANPNRLIRIPIHGLTGPITVKGQEWNANMAALGTTISDQDLAAILSYVRQAWGNVAPPVTPEQVAAVRKETASRAPDGSAPWTADELLKVPVQ